MRCCRVGFTMNMEANAETSLDGRLKGSLDVLNQVLHDESLFPA